MANPTKTKPRDRWTQRNRINLTKLTDTGVQGQPMCKDKHISSWEGKKQSANINQENQTKMGKEQGAEKTTKETKTKQAGDRKLIPTRSRT